jgi:DNA-binding protein YbaB
MTPIEKELIQTQEELQQAQSELQQVQTDLQTVAAVLIGLFGKLNIDPEVFNDFSMDQLPMLVTTVVAEIQMGSVTMEDIKLNQLLPIVTKYKSLIISANGRTE